MAEESRLAFYKVMPSGNLPHRKGPIQTIRSCLSCIRDQPIQLEDGVADIIDFMTYDDLITRKSIWFSSYQTIQYHIGQFELLKVALRTRPGPVLFVIALTNPKDISFLQLAIDHTMPGSDQIEMFPLNSDTSLTTQISNHRFTAIPLLLEFCSTEDETRKSLLFGPRQLQNVLDPVITSTTCDNRDVNIIPIVITKEHDRKCFPGLGTVCIQMLEPFSLKSYIKNANTDYISTHFVQHIYHDISHHAVILPTQIVASILLYSEFDNGIGIDDLIKHLDWFRKASIDLDMHFGFSGDSRKIVEFGLIMLKNYICKNSSGHYEPKNCEELAKYVKIVSSSIAYYGVTALAILAVYNKHKPTKLETTFRPGVQIRVSKDDVLEKCKTLAEAIEFVLPCRRPCIDIETSVDQTITKMHISGRFFKVQEPMIKSNRKTFWAGEDDSDEEYFEMNKNNDAFKTWILTTSDPNKLNLLNLFKNAIKHQIDSLLGEIN